MGPRPRSRLDPQTSIDSGRPGFARVIRLTRRRDSTDGFQSVELEVGRSEAQLPEKRSGLTPATELQPTGKRTGREAGSRVLRPRLAKSFVAPSAPGRLDSDRRRCRSTERRGQHASIPSAPRPSCSNRIGRTVPEAIPEAIAEAVERGRPIRHLQSALMCGNGIDATPAGGTRSARVSDRWNRGDRRLSSPS